MADYLKRRPMTFLKFINEGKIIDDGLSLGLLLELCASESNVFARGKSGVLSLCFLSSDLSLGLFSVDFSLCFFRSYLISFLSKYFLCFGLLVAL